jgi:hypothetical protein
MRTAYFHNQQLVVKKSHDNLGDQWCRRPSVRPLN